MTPLKNLPPLILFIALVYCLPPFHTTLTLNTEEGNASYEQWKRKEEKEWEKSEIDTLGKQKNNLLRDVNYYLTKLEKEPTDKYYQENTLFSYNFLRELYKQSLVKQLSEINKAGSDSF